MVTAFKTIDNRVKCMAPGILLLLPALVLINKTKEAGVEEWLRTKKNNVISCTPYKSVNGLNSWPKDDNSGTGCMHQPVVAALPGKSREKRDAMHNC